MRTYQQDKPEEAKVANFGGNNSQPSDRSSDPDVSVKIDLTLARDKSLPQIKREVSVPDVSPNNIMKFDLVTLVGSIFEEEYDPRKIKKLC